LHGVASYKMTTKLPKELKKYRPSPKEISNIIEKMESDTQ